MSPQELTRLSELLERHYGRLDRDACRSGWEGCLRYLFERQWSASKFAKAWSEIAESWIVHLEEVARAKREELWEFLQPLGASASLVAFLHQLAKWWHGQVQQNRDPLEVEFIPTELDVEEPTAWQLEVVRQDRTLAARLACVVFGSRQFPVTRGIWRVACRHEWLSWHDDPAETSGFFEQLLARNQADMPQFAEWLIRVSEDFCGSKPKCSTCPLQPLLGENGPCEFEA